MYMDQDCHLIHLQRTLGNVGTRVWVGVLKDVFTDQLSVDRTTFFIRDLVRV